MSDNVKLTSTQRAEDFVQQLITSVTKLENTIKTLDRSTNVLGGSFLDENYMVLKMNIRKINKSMEEFIDEHKRIIPTLREKIAEIERLDNLKIE